MNPDRRTLILAVGGGIGLAGCLGNDEGEDDDTETDDDPADSADTVDEDDADNGVDDEGDDAAATVTVGHGGVFVFDPETVGIDVGDTVAFVWDDGGHNILVTDQPDGGGWDGVEETQSAGYTHSHTFDVEGRYEFVCEPHQGQGMDGTVLVGDVQPAPDDDDEDDTPAGGGGY